MQGRAGARLPRVQGLMRTLDPRAQTTTRAALARTSLTPAPAPRVQVYVVDYDNGQPSHESLRPRQSTVALLNMHSLARCVACGWCAPAGALNR